MKDNTLSKRYTLFFMLIFALSDNLFGLLDVDSINVKGVFSLDIIWQIMALGFAIYLYYRNPYRSSVTLNCINVCVLLLLMSCVIAALQCSLLTGQSFVRGILPQRTFIVALSCALLLQGAVVSDLIDVDRIFDMITIIGTIVGLAYLFQAVSGIEIFHVLQNERYGSVRLYMQSCFPDMAGFIGFWRLVKTQRVKYILPAGLAILLSLFVSKGRLELIAILITYLLIMFIVQKKTDIKLFLTMFFALCIISFMSSSYGERLLANFNSKSTESDTTSIRVEGRLLYNNQLHESIINRMFGCGYPNVLYSPAAHRAGLDRGILLGDNGIFAFNYVHGALGLALIICIALLIFKFSFRNRDTEAGLFCLSFLSFSIVTCPNIAWWWNSGAWSMTLALVICCVSQQRIKLGAETKK
nr:hypothetical protein [uncultured Lachnoclostridium sp.]